MPTFYQGLEIDTDFNQPDSGFDTSVLTNFKRYKINSCGDEKLASPTLSGATFERLWPYPNGFTFPDEPAPPPSPPPPAEGARSSCSQKEQGAPDTVWARTDWAPASAKDLAFAYKAPGAPRSPPRKFKRPSRGPFNKVVLPPAWEAILRGEVAPVTESIMGATPEEAVQIMHRNAYFNRADTREKRQRGSVCDFFENVKRSEIDSAVNAWAAGATVWAGA